MKNYIGFCFVILSLSLIGRGEYIKLFPFVKSNASTCREGLAADSDTITVNGEADFNGNNNNGLADHLASDIILIENMYSNASNISTVDQQMCVIDAKTTKGSTSFCFFEALEKDKAFRFSITQPAKLGLVGIRAFLLYKNSTRLTTELKLPGIFDPSSAVITVKIDRQNIRDGASIKITHSYIEIDAHCESILKPCQLQLKFNDTNSVMQGEELLSFKRDYKEPKKLLVTLVAIVCKTEFYQKVFNYEVFSDFETEGSETTTYIIVGVVFGIVLSLIVIVLIILHKKRKFKLLCHCKSRHGQDKTEAQTQQLNGNHNEDDVEARTKDTETIPKGIVGDRRQIYDPQPEKNKQAAEPLLDNSLGKTLDEMPSTGRNLSACQSPTNDDSLSLGKGDFDTNHISLNKGSQSNETSTIEILPLKKKSTNQSIPVPIGTLQLEDSEKPDSESDYEHDYESIEF